MDKSGDDLAKMISQLMADEKFSETIAAVKESLAASSDGSSTSAENVQVPSVAKVSSQESAPTSFPSIPPELISKLPEIMSLLGASGGNHSSGNEKTDKRTKLLNALKPFLSDRRKGAVDSIINIAGIAELFGLK